MVFDVDHRRETGLLKRRIVVFVPGGVSLGVGWTAGAFVVNGEPSHADDAFGFRPNEPVHDVDVVRALLQKKSGRVLLFGMPVAEISVAAVADEMTAPAALDIADDARINDLFHLENRGEIAHIVSDEQLASAFVRGAQNAVAAFDRDRHRFFKEKSLSRLERGNGLLFMAVVRRCNHGSIDFLDFQQIDIVVKHACLRKLFLKLFPCGGFRVRSGDDLPALFRLVHLPAVVTASADSNQSDFHHFHLSKLLVFTHSAGSSISLFSLE